MPISGKFGKFIRQIAFDSVFKITILMKLSKLFTFSVVKEEIVDESTVLPVFNGRVISWVRKKTF